MTHKITTNGQARLLLSWRELTDKERLDFDYLDTEDTQESAEFFRYKGQCYDLCEFEATAEFCGDGRGLVSIPGWDGYHGDSFFSGIVVRYVREDRDRREIDTDRIIVGTLIEQSDY